MTHAVGRVPDLEVVQSLLYLMLSMAQVWVSLLACWRGLVKLAAKDPGLALVSLLEGLHDCLSAGPLVRSPPEAGGHANGHADLEGNIGHKADRENHVERGGSEDANVESPKVQLLLDALQELLEYIDGTALLHTTAKPPCECTHSCWPLDTCTTVIEHNSRSIPGIDGL